MNKQIQGLFFSVLISVSLAPGTGGSSESPTGAALPPRPPAVAGKFYPGDSTALRKNVQDLLDNVPGETAHGNVRALISPHAGYRYSGIVAAAGYKQVHPDTKRAILLGPSHRVRFEGASIPKTSAYETPLGPVVLDELATTLRQSPGFNSVAGAHLEEHSLEVQLPFLQVRLEAFTIVPVLTGNGNPAALATTLFPYIDEETLVVASSDLSHYHPYTDAVSLDRQCINAIAAMDFSGVRRCEACGKEAILTLMHLARIKGWTPRLIDYKNSGNTAGGRDRVVGYASIAFLGGKERQIEMESNDLSHKDKLDLLKLARSAIAAKLVPGVRMVRPPPPSQALLEDRGCFVTLHKNGQLRGCIGCIEPVSTLMACIEAHAESAAFHDPRFPPVTAEELEAIDIEISVLTVPEDLAFTDGEDLKSQLEPHIHGVILSRGFRTSTFLPQVWKQLPDKESFLQHLCVKGGMPADAWKDPRTKVQVYKAGAFGEKDPDIAIDPVKSS